MPTRQIRPSVSVMKGVRFPSRTLTYDNSGMSRSCLVRRTPRSGVCALREHSRRFLSSDFVGSSAVPPPPPPPPASPSRAPPHHAAATPHVEEDALDDDMTDLLFQSMDATNDGRGVSPENALPDEALYPSSSHSPSVPADSTCLLAAEREVAPHEVEEELAETLGQEEALDYIEAIDDFAQYQALTERDADSDGVDDAADALSASAGLFWWQRQAKEDVANAVHLQIPDRTGHVQSALTTSSSDHTRGPTQGSHAHTPSHARMMNGSSYLTQMDRLYLSYPARPEVRLPPPSWRTTSSSASTASRQCTQDTSGCVLVVYAANDLRVHDHYPLALASARARALGVPVVAVCVVDYRTFAQPSLVGGFFRQSPQRAQWLLDTVEALRHKLEDTYHVPLLVRCGRPEEHVPRLAVELGAVDVYVTTQYAPHERRVHDAMMDSIRTGTWHSRQAVLPYLLEEDSTAGVVPLDEARAAAGDDNATHCHGDDDDVLLYVHVHSVSSSHPYALTSPSAVPLRTAPAAPHSVWQTTLVHLDDLPTPVAAMKEGERWYHDDVTIAAIRPTAPYNEQAERLRQLPTWDALLPSEDERRGAVPAPVYRGRLPTLADLGYGDVTSAEKALRLFAFEDVIATQSSHPAAGEDAAIAHVHDWLTGNDGSSSSGMASLLRLGRERRTNTKMYSEKLARVSPYLANGALSPRAYYEAVREYTHATLRDGFAQMQYREALLRLSRRDYWHWMGLRYGARLFYSYGPRPEDTDVVPDWRCDDKIVQKWCLGLTGIPFADAAMRELLGTGFVAHEGRQALMWLLATGLGQDWRLGAEWLERCSLDYDPFVCYGNAAYCAQLIPDDFGEPVRGVHYLAHQHDQTGIYVKKWLPQLSKVPPVYIHRPHVMSPRMQAMHGVYLGKNYPYPIKLWHGAQHASLRWRGDLLTALYPNGIVRGPGVGEAARHGEALMEPEEWNMAITETSVDAIGGRAWAQAHLPEDVLHTAADTAPQLGRGANEDDDVQLVHIGVNARRGTNSFSLRQQQAHGSME